MAKKIIQQNELSEAIVAVLSRAPSRVGLRLRSEPVLARHLAVPRWRVREVFNQLETQGILIRRKGSGTYIRKVPRLAEVDFSSLPMAKQVRQYLFYEEDIVVSEAVVPLQPTSTQTCLHLAVWGIHDQTEVNRQMLLAIKKCAIERGHYLTIHPTSSTPDSPYSVEKLKALFKDNHADGYIVASPAAENILQAMGATHAPMMFISGSNHLISHEPSVMRDLEDAVSRGIRILAGEGYRRIGLVGLDTDLGIPNTAYRSLEHIYKVTLSELGLDDCKAIFCHPDSSEAIHAAEQLLAGPMPPDALCVADDHVMVGVAEALMVSPYTPGKDFGVICTGDRLISPSLPGPTWSRIEFDMQWYAQLVVDTLLRFIQTADSRMGNLKVLGNWCPGETHLRESFVTHSNSSTGDNA